jgi:hypothetical protein
MDAPMEPPAFHEGEREAQRRADFLVKRAPIRDFLTEQLRGQVDVDWESKSGHPGIERAWTADIASGWRWRLPYRWRPTD